MAIGNLTIPCPTVVPASRRALVSWALYDWANSAFPTLIQTFVFAAYFTRSVARNETVGTAQWGNMLAAAALVVALGGPFLGAVADQTGRRKPWIALFTVLCVVPTALLWFIEPRASHVGLALALVALGTIGVEYASIFYNAMLPNLTSPQTLGRWSGWGWAMGYGGGLSCLLIALYVFVKPNPPLFGLERGSAEHVRATFVMVAAWFAVFSIPLFLFTPDAPSTGKRLLAAARDGAKQLLESVRQVRKYSNILRFLIARMIYIDGLATMFAFGGVFAAGTFDMTEEEVLGFGIALNVTAGLGAAAFAWLDDYFGSKQTILVSLVGLIIASTCMLIGKSPTMFWIFGLVLGIFVGPVQAASRSFLARIAPEGLCNQMFGLYAFSGKATSFLGPLLVGWFTYQFGSQRAGMAAIVALFVVGGLLLLGVPGPKKPQPNQPSPSSP